MIKQEIFWGEGVRNRSIIGYNLVMGKNLYLKVGDKVRHIKYSVWGTGEVIEEKHSASVRWVLFCKDSVPGWK